MADAMIFASINPEKRDRKPWVAWGVRYATQVSPSAYYSPRVEYVSTPPSNPVNPILAAFRSATKVPGDGPYRAFYWSLAIDQFDTYGGPADASWGNAFRSIIRATDEQREHAYRVFNRLSELTEWKELG